MFTPVSTVRIGAARALPLALAALLLPGGAFAAEYAVLQAGTRVRVERHEMLGPMARLHLPGGGFVEISSAEVVRFEREEYTPPPPPSPARENPAATPAAAAPEIESIVRETGQRHGLDADLIRSVIRAESGGRVRAVSPKGAGGLMQLMPGTARQLNVSDVFDPRQNVDGGTRYLRELLERYNGNLQLALAAYNAGPHRVEQYQGVPPYRETHGYIRRVITNYNKQKLAAGQ